MKLIKRFLLIVGMFSLSIAPISLSTSYVLAADIDQKLCNGASLVAPGGSGDCSADQGGTKITVIVNQVVNIFSWIVGVVSVIMIIYGGFRYITSGGDSNGVTAAKNTILYAIIGLVIVALAQVIVKFVLQKSGEVAA